MCCSNTSENVILSDKLYAQGTEDYARPQVQGTIGDASLPTPARPLPKPITIEPLNHGYAITVGCQRFAIETVDALLHRLNVYLKDPMETESRWLRGEWKW
jgi:hypothetical protein